MKTAILQPYFFPYLGYWQLINYVDTLVIHEDVQYIKNGWINRNNIISNSEKFLITLPVKKFKSDDKINQVYLVNDKKTIGKILRQLKNIYAHAPYFKDVMPILEKVLTNAESNIAEYMIFQIKEVLNYLQIETRIIKSSDLEKNNALKAQERVIDICKATNTNHYINPIGGQELYNKKDFNDKKIQLNFIQSNLPEYPQFNSKNFIAGLSIIDILMNNSTEEIKIMLTDFTLI